MALELPDVWALSGLVLALLALVLGVISVPGASRIEFVFSRVFAVAAAVLFLVKLALWGAEDLTITRTLFVAFCGALIAVGAAFALQWINKKEIAISPGRPAPSETQVPAVDNHPAQATPNPPQRGGTFLDAEDSQNITIEGGYIGGADTGYRLKRVEGLQSNNVTFDRNGDLAKGKGLPPPPPELAALSNSELKQRIAGFCNELRAFRAGFDRQRGDASTKRDRIIESNRGLNRDQFKQVWIAAHDEQIKENRRLDQAESADFASKYLHIAISLTAAVAAKTGGFYIPPKSSSVIRQGGTIVSLGRPVGPEVEEAVAQFLAEISGRLGP